MIRFASSALMIVVAYPLLGSTSGRAATPVPIPSVVQSLDGAGWLLATDPQNVGRTEQWWKTPRPDAKPVRVPWIIQGTYPGYHGVVWYWSELSVPAPPCPGSRFLLHFGAVDYRADVWLNDTHVGGHEGGETPFEIDVTNAIHADAKNRLAVRVLNPGNEPIDGVTLLQTARRCKVVPFSAGAAFDHGGIVGPVELVITPEVRITDLHVVARAEPGTEMGKVTFDLTVRNESREDRPGTIDLSIAPAASGPALAEGHVPKTFPPGETRLTTELSLAQPHLWELNDPCLYRATSRIRIDGSPSQQECSTRFGFRDFRFADGCFQLNGRRIYLRSTHTCNHFPIGLQYPADPDFRRRDLLNLKAMGFNAVRFIWGGADPRQLDYCDEIGLLVYEESYASAPIADCPEMVDRFDTNVSELIRRDRNHVSVVIWGLLNEAPDGLAFRHAVAMLPLVRKLDDTRMVLLNSGRYDYVNNSPIGQVPGLRLWPHDPPSEPWVGVNGARDTVRALGITWPPGMLALHPGANGEYSVIRWTAPTEGSVDLEAVFTGIAERATTDVHVLQNGRSLLDADINLKNPSNQARFEQKIAVKAGDTLDCVVGFGNGSYGADSTGLKLTIRTPDGQAHDAAAEFSIATNPNGAWSYGRLLPGPSPDAGTFARHPVDPTGGRIGSLCNPGNSAWEDIIADRHVYPRVPHTREIIDSLRTLNNGAQPVFLSEYGIGSAVDLWRAVRHFEQRGATDLEDAQFFTTKLNQYLADYDRWHMETVFPRPEDFFAASLRKMASQRTLGLNAIRSNPNIVGHSLTGAIDHVMCGEGLTTLFRELKPGTIDALFDAWAPLRWCLFAEPAHIYRGQKVRLEAVLANEDVLGPGTYPARLQVIGPNATTVFDRTIDVVIPPRDAKVLPPLAVRYFDEEVTIDGPEGEYHFVATFLRGAAAAGGPANFFVTDRALMPGVKGEVVVWGNDPGLVEWLAKHGIRNRPFGSTPSAKREVILVGTEPPAGDRAEAFRALEAQIASGSTAIFLVPTVFAEGKEPTRWLPLEHKGILVPINGWLYLKDEWAKQHPIFNGLPAGGLMDYTYYREIIPDLVFTGQNAPADAVAGAIKASQDYASGLMLAVYPHGAGRFVINTLRIRENLDTHPAAERLLRNLLNFAASEVTTSLDRKARGPAPAKEGP